MTSKYCRLWSNSFNGLSLTPEDQDLNIKKQFSSESIYGVVGVTGKNL